MSILRKAMTAPDGVAGRVLLAAACVCVALGGSAAATDGGAAPTVDGGAPVGALKAPANADAAWKAARLDVQRGLGVRAWSTLQGAGLVSGDAAERWQVGVRGMAAWWARVAEAPVLLRSVVQPDLPPEARLAVVARVLGSCASPCEPVPEVDTAVALRLPPITLERLLAGMARVDHPGTRDLARAVNAATPWARGPAPPHERAALLATVHGVLRKKDPKDARALAWWTWQHLPTEPSVKNVIAGLTEEDARATVGVPGLMRHLQSRLEANDNAAVVDFGGRLCAGAVTADGKPCPALAGADACEAAFSVGKAQRQMRAYADAEATLGVVAAACPDHRARAWFLQGRAMAAQEGGTPRAVVTFEALAKGFKDHALADDALVAAGQLLARHKGSKARDAWERVAREFPDGDMAPEAAWFLAWQAHVDGKDDESIKRLDALVVSARERSPLHWRRALYWRARLEPDGAKAARLMTALVETLPQTFEAGMARAWLAHAGHPVPLEHPLGAPWVDPPVPARLDALAAAATALERAGMDEDAASLLVASEAWQRKDPASDLWVAARLVALGDAPDASRGMRVRHAKTLKGTPTADTAIYWKLAWPRAHEDAITAAAREHGLPPALLMALAREESAFDARVTSWAGAVGLTQLMPTTAKAEASALGLQAPSVVDLLDPVLNARLGGAHLARHLREFNGNPACALGAYNAGASRVRTWLKRHGGEDLDAFIEHVPIDETRGYMKRVLDSYAHYTLLLGEGPPVTLPRRPTEPLAWRSP